MVHQELEVLGRNAACPGAGFVQVARQDECAARLSARQIFGICIETIGGIIVAAIFALTGAWRVASTRSEDLDVFGIGLAGAAIGCELLKRTIAAVNAVLPENAATKSQRIG